MKFRPKYDNLILRSHENLNESFRTFALSRAISLKQECLEPERQRNNKEN